MAIVRVNMDKRSKGGIPLPDGDYVCEVVQAVDGESSQKKSPQLNVTLEVISPEQYAGSRMIDFLPLTEAAAFRAADFIYACGVDEPGENDVDTDQFSRLDAEGNETQEKGAVVNVKRVTEEDEYQGVKRKRARLFYSRVAGEEAAAEEEAQEAPAPVAPKPAIKKAVAAPAKPASKLKVKA
jgi:hypothetical protein